MVSAIVFLLRRDENSTTNNDSAKAHAVAIFLAGVAVLGLDAYIFGSVASIRPPTLKLSDGGEVIREGSQYICTIVWTQGMSASGMLAVGGVLMLAGLGWTTTQFALNIRPTSKSLGILGNLVTFIVIVTVVAALWETSLDYLDVMASPPIDENFRWQRYLVNYGSIMVLCACTLLVLTRTLVLGRDIQQVDPSKSLIEGQGRERILRWAIYLTGVLTFCGPLAPAFLPQQGNAGECSMTFALVFGIGLPYLIFLAIAYTVPGPVFSQANLKFSAKSKKLESPPGEA
jgi:hypothetical protein